MRAVAVEGMPDEVNVIVREQVQAFVTACSVAGPDDKRPDVNQKPRLPLHKVAAERDTKPAKQQSVESNYVASKNGQVFHRADCQFAAKILPANLVSYSTREQAITAGKRPCKSCNP